MGELDELVSTLLGTFTSGIRLLRARRKRQKSSSGKTDHDNCEETLLIKSFKQSRSDIREAYTRESIKSGPKFSDGDGMNQSPDVCKLHVLISSQRKPALHYLPYCHD